MTCSETAPSSHTWWACSPISLRDAEHVHIYVYVCVCLCEYVCTCQLFFICEYY